MEENFESKHLENVNPIDQAIRFWVERKSSLIAFFNNIRLVSPLIQIVKLSVKDRDFLEEHSEPFIDGLVIFAQGWNKNDIRKMELGEGLMKPMIDKVISYLSSQSFHKYNLEKHVTGQEKVPITVPEVFITIEALLLFLKRHKTLVITAKDVGELKKKFILDYMESLGINDDNYKRIKELDMILYSDIFSPGGFLMFNHIMSKQKLEGKGIFSDIAYFYHNLVMDKFIHAKIEKFKTWFEKLYPDFPMIERFHALDRITTTHERKERYAAALNFLSSKKT